LVDSKPVASTTELGAVGCAQHVTVAGASNRGAGSEAIAAVALVAIFRSEILVARAEAGTVLERQL